MNKTKHKNRNTDKTISGKKIKSRIFINNKFKKIISTSKTNIQYAIFIRKLVLDKIKYKYCKSTDKNQQCAKNKYRRRCGKTKKDNETKTNLTHR